jgi:hypothetical protein
MQPTWVCNLTAATFSKGHSIASKAQQNSYEHAIQTAALLPPKRLSA